MKVQADKMLSLRFISYTLLLLLTSAFGLPPSWRPALSPPWLGKLLAALGPALTWAPLLPLSRPSPLLRRALLLSMCAWLVCIAPIQLLRRLAPPLDPSGHIFLFGAQLLPLWEAQRTMARGAASSKGAAGAGSAAAAALPSSLLPPLLLLLEGALLIFSAATAAFYHSPADVAAAWACVALLFCFVRCSGRAPPTRRAVLVSGCLWAVLGTAMLAALVARGAKLPRSLPQRAAHDLLVFAAGLWLAGGAEA